MPAKGWSLRKRVLVSGAIVAGLLLLGLLEHRLLTGDFTSFARSPFLLVDIAGGVVAAFAIEYGYSGNHAQEIPRSTQWKLALLALATAIALSADVYAALSGTFVATASVISLTTLVILGFALMRSLHSRGNRRSSQERETCPRITRILLGVAMLGVFAGLIFVHIH